MIPAAIFNLYRGVLLRPSVALCSFFRSRTHAVAHAAIMLLATSPLSQAGSVLDAIGEEVSAIYEQSKDCVVRVKAEPDAEGGTRMGSGFFIDESGKLLTTATVACKSKRVWIEWNDERFPVEIVGSDQRANLALLRVAGNENPPRRFPALRLGDSRMLKIGTVVVAMGNPFDLAPSPSFGIVEGFDLHQLTRLFTTSHIRTDIPLSPGESGGPLLNSRGEAVGILVAVSEQSFPSYALPIHAVQRLLPDFEEHGKARYGWLGLGVLECPLEEAAPDKTARCIKVQQVFSNTPAARVGIQPGDHIVKMAGTPIHHLSDMVNVSFQAHVGDRLELQIRRADVLTNFVVEVVERPSKKRGPKLAPAAQSE